MSYSTWRELTKIFLQKYVWRESKYLYHIHLLFLLFRCGYRINNLHTLVNQLHACCHGQLFATPWTTVHQVSKSMGFSRQECCSGLPFPTPGDLPNPGIEPMSLACLGLAGRFFTTVPSGKPEYINSVQFSHSVVSDLLWPHGLQDTRLQIHHQLPDLAQTYVHRVGDTSNHLSSVIPFSSCFQSLPASESFPMNQFFTSSGQSIGASASASVLPMNIQDWFPLGLTVLIPLQSKGLSRVFSNTTVQKHQFFGAQFSLWSNSYIHTWLLEKP